MWDAVMNYQFTRACIAFFIGENLEEAELRKTSLHPLGPLGAEAFARALERLIGLYAPSITDVMLNLLGSHDTGRFLTLARNDATALRLATAFQMTYPGAPSIYYGDEIGMRGGHDPANRGAFPWYQVECWDTELLHEFQRLIALRRARPALRRGTFRVLHGSGDIFVHARQLGDETILAAFNTARSTRRMDLRLGGLVPQQGVLEEVWTRKAIVIEGGTIRLEIPPRSSLILATPSTSPG
jgi:neopullulanase